MARTEIRGGKSMVPALENTIAKVTEKAAKRICGFFTEKRAD